MKRKRLNIKAMLADPEVRRELFVGVIVSTQAREGITTTREQALDAYYKVSSFVPVPSLSRPRIAN